MKTIKIVFFSLLVLFVGTSIITSCSKDDETDKNVSKNAKVSTYLKSFYSKSFELGKSVNSRVAKPSSSTSKTVEFEDIVVTEVFVGDDSRARGYVVTSKSNNIFLYFVDVDRVDYKMTTVDITVNDKKEFENIEQLDKYVSTNGFDFIKVTEEYMAEQSHINDKRRFWGWGDAPDGACGPNSNGDGGCSYGTYTQHYIFWIADGGPVATGDVYPCSCH